MRKIISIAMILILMSLSMGMGMYENTLTEVDVTTYGATANDSTDDTASIQKAINTGAATVIIPDGTYMINGGTKILPKSNQLIQMGKNTVLKAIPTSSAYYSIINLTDVKNVEISGGTIIGERYEHTGTTGEYGYGISICNGTNNITIRDITIKDCWGDGIFIGSGPTPARNIYLDNVICDNNRRQGMSITFAENVIVNNCTFKNTNGTAPEAGIDVEPYAKDGYVKNVLIENCIFSDNKWAGIAMFGEYGLYVANVKILNCLFSNNSYELRIGENVIDSGFTDTIVMSSYDWVTSSEVPLVDYRTQVQDIGWQGFVINGSVAGTSGQSKRLEAINITLDNLEGGIEYKTHVQDIGWMDWTADGSMSGTSGQSKRLEAIEIRLTGKAADEYDIYYRVHVQDTGWLDWAMNGQPAGTAGFSYRLEAIQIVLVNKAGTAPGLTERSFVQAN